MNQSTSIPKPELSFTEEYQEFKPPLEQIPQQNQMQQINYSDMQYQKQITIKGEGGQVPSYPVMQSIKPALPLNFQGQSQQQQLSQQSNYFNSEFSQPKTEEFQYSQQSQSEEMQNQTFSQGTEFDQSEVDYQQQKELLEEFQRKKQEEEAALKRKKQEELELQIKKKKQEEEDEQFAKQLHEEEKRSLEQQKQSYTQIQNQNENITLIQQEQQRLKEEQLSQDLIQSLQYEMNLENQIKASDYGKDQISDPACKGYYQQMDKQYLNSPKQKPSQVDLQQQFQKSYKYFQNQTNCKFEFPDETKVQKKEKKWYQKAVQCIQNEIKRGKSYIGLEYKDIEGFPFLVYQYMLCSSALYKDRYVEVWSPKDGMIAKDFSVNSYREAKEKIMQDVKLYYNKNREILRKSIHLP